jgi:hypothetical protein
MMAARYGTGEAVDLLLAEGADARLKNQQGDSTCICRGERPDARKNADSAGRQSQYQPVSGPLRGVGLVLRPIFGTLKIFYDVYYVKSLRLCWAMLCCQICRTYG